MDQHHHQRPDHQHTVSCTISHEASRVCSGTTHGPDYLGRHVRDIVACQEAARMANHLHFSHAGCAIARLVLMVYPDPAAKTDPQCMFLFPPYIPLGQH